MDDFEARAREALADPQNVGEMADADAVGTAGSADCGDMLRCSRRVGIKKRFGST